MSVRAYIIRKYQIEFDDNLMIFKKVIDIDPLFNVLHDSKILELFQNYGHEFLNQDIVGEITLNRKEWGDFKKNFEKEEWNQKELEILDKINNELKIEEDIWCECF